MKQKQSVHLLSMLLQLKTARGREAPTRSLIHFIYKLRIKVIITSFEVASVLNISYEKNNVVNWVFETMYTEYVEVYMRRFLIAIIALIVLGVGAFSIQHFYLSRKSKMCSSGDRVSIIAYCKPKTNSAYPHSSIVNNSVILGTENQYNIRPGGTITAKVALIHDEVWLQMEPTHPSSILPFLDFHLRVGSFSYLNPNTIKLTSNSDGTYSFNFLAPQITGEYIVRFRDPARRQIKLYVMNKITQKQAVMDTISQFVHWKLGVPTNSWDILKQDIHMAKGKWQANVTFGYNSCGMGMNINNCTYKTVTGQFEVDPDTGLIL